MGDGRCVGSEGRSVRGSVRGVDELACQAMMLSRSTVRNLCHCGKKGGIRLSLALRVGAFRMALPNRARECCSGRSRGAARGAARAFCFSHIGPNTLVVRYRFSPNLAIIFIFACARPLPPIFVFRRERESQRAEPVGSDLCAARCAAAACVREPQ